jgi:hypothetical protein
VHLLRFAFEKSSTSANKQRITGKHCSLVTIFEEVANAVLGMTWRVKGLHLDAVTDRESRAICRSLADFDAVLATDDGQLVVLELWIYVSLGERVAWGISGHTISAFPPAWSWWLGLVKWNPAIPRFQGLLMRVNNANKLDLATICLFFEHG